MKKLTITLFGATGTRTLEITPCGGLPTRHVKAPRETGFPSVFAPETPKAPAADRTPKPTTLPTSTTEKSNVPSPAEEFPFMLLKLSSSCTPRTTTAVG